MNGVMKFETIKGDTLPALQVNVGESNDGKKENGFVTDPTGAIVKFSMWKIEDETIKVNAAAGSVQNVALNSDGTYYAELVYAWVAADVDTKGQYPGRFTLTIGADTISIPKKKGELLVIIDD